MSEQFDRLSKGLAQGMSRRTALKLFGAGLVGTAFAGLTGTASAAPQTCVTCICGVGRPCNPKSSTCAEIREFPATQMCEAACERQGQRLCGTGNAFHCPRGCPS